MSYSCRIDCHRTGEGRRFADVRAAEAYARKRVAATGQEFQLSSLAEGSNGHLIAFIRKDSADRVWTDVAQHQDSLI